MRHGRRNAALAVASCAVAFGAPVLALAGGSRGAGKAGAVNVHRLPLGDGHVSATAPRRGWVYVCSTMTGGGGAFRTGSWIHSDGTFDLTAKPVVDGRVAWPAARVRFTRRDGRVRITGNGLPVGQTTGVFPIAPTDDAYAYDRNPNSIAGQRVSLTLPRATRSAHPGCLTDGPVGYAIDGVAIFDALDAEDRDAVAHEIQDRCDGHPQQQGVYHYHSIPACLTRGSRGAKLVGWMLDGYPIVYEPGTTNARLDACHGRTSTVTIAGRRVRTYHYDATAEYPYTIGCFRGRALRAAPPGPPA